MINGEILDEFGMETACAALDTHGAGLLLDSDSEETRDLYTEANALRARLDEVADAYEDGDLDLRQYTPPARAHYREAGHGDGQGSGHKLG